MTEEKIHQIGDQEIKDSDLTQEQKHHKSHILSLRNKISKLQFEIDDLMPSLKWHEAAMLRITKEQAEKFLEEEEASEKES